MLNALLGSPAVERLRAILSGPWLQIIVDGNRLVMRLEAENWKIALERYEGHPIAALTLAFQLIGSNIRFTQASAVRAVLNMTRSVPSTDCKINASR